MSTKNTKADSQIKAEFMTALTNVLKEISEIEDIKIPRAWKHVIDNQAITIFISPDED